MFIIIYICNNKTYAQTIIVVCNFHVLFSRNNKINHKKILFIYKFIHINDTSQITFTKNVNLPQYKKYFKKCGKQNAYHFSKVFGFFFFYLSSVQI